MAEVPIAQAAPYAAADVDIPLRLRTKLIPELDEKRLWPLFTDVEIPLIPVLSDMEQAGVRLDVDALRQMSVELADRLADLEERIYARAGQEFNINSTQQLSQVLFEDLELPTEGLRRTQNRSLLHRPPVCSSRSKDPTKSSILYSITASYPSSSRPTSTRSPKWSIRKPAGSTRPSTQVGAITGRLASNNPNLQNIPIRTELGRQVRRAFVARPGWLFLAVDYSQVELRVLAHISQDPGLLEAFSRGDDIHAATAAAIYHIPLDQVTSNQRRFAKSVNFGLLYGMSAFRLARESDLTLGEAERFQQAYFDSFPNVRHYLEQTIRQAGEQGWVETVLGRRRYFPVLQGAAGSRTSALAQQRAEREAVNFPIQGSAADIIKIAMINLHRILRERDFEARMLLQVHDELVLEVPQAEIEPVTALVVDLMENAYELRAPLRADTKIGPNWLEMS